jgi:tetratricopeptide (TPR) repeat protein
MSILPVPSGKQNESYEQIRKSIAAAQENGDSKAVVSLYKKLGQAYMDAGDAPQALTEFNEAIKLVFNGDEKEAFAQLLGLRGLALKSIGNYSLALQAFRKSHALALEINHPALSCDALIHAGTLHSEMGKAEEAVAALNDALKVAVENKDKVRKMRVYGLMGDNFFRQPDSQKAAENYLLACDVAQDLMNRAAECSFITKLGNVLLMEGKLEAANDKYERALKLASVLGDRNAEINILGGLFRSHALSGDVKLAQVYGEQTIQLAGEIEHVEAELANIHALATFLIDQRHFDPAMLLLDRGLQVVREQTDLSSQMELLDLQGKAFSLQEKYNEALESWNMALTLASNLQDEELMARLFGRMAAIFAETGDLEKSVECAEKALELALVNEDSKLASEQQILLAFNFRDSGQKENAIEACRAAIDGYQSINEQDMVAQAKTLLADLES